MRVVAGAVLALLTAAGAASSGSAQEGGVRQEVVTIASAASTGIYFKAGRALCELMVRPPALVNRCVTQVTAGSVENIELLRSGRVDLAIVQEDVAQRASAGDWQLENPGPFVRLTYVVPLHVEALTVVVRELGSLEPPVDASRLPRLGLGAKGSGDRSTAEDVLGRLGWRAQHVAASRTVTRDGAVRALCDGEVDAVLMVTGHPVPVGRQVLGERRCSLRFLDLGGVAERIVGRCGNGACAPLDHHRITGYGAAGVDTVGLHALLVSHLGVGEPLIRELVKRMVATPEVMQAAHPAYAGLRLGCDGGSAGDDPSYRSIRAHRGVVLAREDLGARPAPPLRNVSAGARADAAKFLCSFRPAGGR